MARRCIVAGCDGGAASVHEMCKLHAGRFSVARADYRRRKGIEIGAEEWAERGGRWATGNGEPAAERTDAYVVTVTVPGCDRGEDETAAPDVTDRLVDLFLARTDWTAMPTVLKRRIVQLCLDELG